MNEDTSTIRTIVQATPEVRVSLAYRQSSGMYCQGMWYWESWCFSDDPRVRSFQGSIAYGREKAQRIHDSLVRCVTKTLEVK